MEILEQKLAEAGTKAVILCLFLYLLATLLFTGKQPSEAKPNLVADGQGG